MGFSVIVPTMWKYPPFLDFLKDLVSEFTIREIIIINNDKDNTPLDDIFEHHKIKMWWFQEGNIGVNPAWNFGVANASEDKICLMNDDIIFDLKIFNKIHYRLSFVEGVYGLCHGEGSQPKTTNGMIEFVHTPVPYNPGTHFGFGQLMFFNKRNWMPIPYGLKIYWGDNYIYDIFHHKTNKNYLITNMFFHTPGAQTSTKVLTDAMGVCNQEGIIYNQIMPSIVKEILESKQ